MYRRKIIQKMLILLCVVSVVLGIAAIAIAAGVLPYVPYLRPANPTMDYVPQNIGIYDTYYDEFKEPDCRACHGTSTAERHHGTQQALSGDCLYCHSVASPVAPLPASSRDCRTCHIDSGPLGDLGFPHHNSDLADSDQCTACHDPNLLVETNSVEPPTYEATTTTPTPYSCENCHWPSGLAAHQDSTYQGANNVAEFLADWYGWNTAGIGPKPTTWPDALAHPAPIEANGQVDVGILRWDTTDLKPYASLWGDPGAASSYNRSGVDMINKPYRPLSGTHHEVDGTIYWKCYNCHGSSPASPTDWVPTDPLLIRYCENCHDVGTLHSISEHIAGDDIYRVGGNPNQLVTGNEKCVACHGDRLPLLPPLPAAVPIISVMEPNFGSAGVVVVLTPTVAGAFGTKLANDTVLVGQQEAGSCAGVEYAPVPIYSWAEDEVQFKIPGWTYDPGNLCVRVQKQTTLGLKKSLIQVFTLRKHPVIDNLNPSGGTLSTSAILVNGDGFGVQREKVYGNGYGFSSYVELHASNDKYRVTKYPTPWTDTQIKIKLATSFTAAPPTLNLLDLNATPPNTLIDPSQFYEGCWEVYVFTDYFKDDGDGKYLKYLSGDPITGPIGTIDSGDELLYREISDPVCFNAADTPYINAIKPSKAGSNNQIGRVLRGNTVKLYGVNYGPMKKTPLPGDLPNVANDNVFVCNGSGDVPPSVNCTRVATTLWTNTTIQFKAPLVGGYPATKWIKVHVADATTSPNSNPKKLIIR